MCISTLADIAHYPWVAASDSIGIDIEQFPTLTAWQERMLRRPAVARGMEKINPDSPAEKQ